MTRLETELLLILGIWALHLWDAARLLYVDEVLIVRNKGHWHVVSGALFEIRGRFLHLPGPWSAARSVFVSSWLKDDASIADDPSATLTHFHRQHRWVRGACLLSAMLVLLGIPALLIYASDPAWLLAVLVGAELCALIALVSAWRQRATSGLRIGKWLALATESLLCPPCAANLYRKLCALHSDHAEVLALAERMSAAEQSRLLNSIDARVALFSESNDANPVANNPVARMRTAHARLKSALLEDPRT